MVALLFVLFPIHLQAMTDCIPKDPAHARMKIYETGAWPNAVTRVSFDSIRVKMMDVFTDEVARKLGCRYWINDLWNDGTINAQAYYQGGYCMVDAFGGMARYPRMTNASFIAVMCHELGHFMGGAPLYPGDRLSNEGESDYWSTLYCMRKMGLNGRAAAVTLARVLAELTGEGAPSTGTKDRTVVRRTVHEHPRAQCRLDTMLAGQYCNGSGRMSPADPRVGACYKYPNGVADTGDRPRCWFKP